MNLPATTTTPPAPAELPEEMKKLLAWLAEAGMNALAVAITHAHVRATAKRLGVATRTAWRKSR